MSGAYHRRERQLQNARLLRALAWLLNELRRDLLALCERR